jgi:hypothetical protein
MKRGRANKLKIQYKLFKDILDFIAISEKEGHKITKTSPEELTKLCMEILGCSRYKARNIVNFLFRIYFSVWDY